MVYADYEYYKSTFLGTAIELPSFDHYAKRASDYIDYITFGKAEKFSDNSHVKDACCAIAEQMQLEEKAQNVVTNSLDNAIANNGEVTSETVGEWSVSKTTGMSAAESSNDYRSALRGEMYAIAQQYLLTTGLLYRGGCR